jgi:hypothetical protein
MDVIEQARVLREVLDTESLALLWVQSAEVNDIETHEAVSIALRMVPAPTQIH